jgi:fructose-1,6-bisphosphatase
MLAVIDNFSTESTLKDIIGSESPVIFYTKNPWSGDNNNYIKKDTKYFIIDTGYYYYYSGITGISGITGTSESVTIGGDNLDESIQIFDYNKYSDKIKYY